MHYSIGKQLGWDKLDTDAERRACTHAVLRRLADASDGYAFSLGHHYSVSTQDAAAHHFTALTRGARVLLPRAPQPQPRHM
jgi:phage tail tube protein FII